MTYISGKITGDSNYKAKFAAAEAKLRKQGHECINPTKLDCVSDKLSYGTYIELCLTLLRECDTVYVLPDWQDSKGAKLELGIAKMHGKKIIYAGGVL